MDLQKIFDNAYILALLYNSKKLLMTQITIPKVTTDIFFIKLIFKKITDGIIKIVSTIKFKEYVPISDKICNNL